MLLPTPRQERVSSRVVWVCRHAPCKANFSGFMGFLRKPVNGSLVQPTPCCCSWRWACGPCRTRPRQPGCRWRLSTLRSVWLEGMDQLLTGRQSTLPTDRHNLHGWLLLLYMKESAQLRPLLVLCNWL